LANFAITICDTSLTRDQPGIDAGAGLDGRYAPPTILPAGDLDSDVVTAYKNPGPSRTRIQDQQGRHCRRFVHGAGRIQTMKGVPDVGIRRTVRTRKPAEAPAERARAAS
jgi:hypothetical protein